ncbi:NRDE family protein [Salicibibacter cibi]|uniref:NRDE family protein n=2 Tax=Salicibibacter cibi TaxID=2743001 RepID=A0A7T7CH34_9BACI|nr:NRDE family protein [Salicibibacter cibi]QQK81843.1 NRDE family protein [Salicibibacter cibi]
MCLINFQWKSHEKYPLIIAANRDEFYERSTAPAHFWEDAPDLLAGRDLLQKGTWLGITKQGKFAALTNFRDPQQIVPGKSSRGAIVKQFLTENRSPKGFMESLRKHRDDYTGYNVVAGTLDEMYHYNNVHDELNKINPGTHGLSNDSLNTSWPKVVKGKQALNAYTSKEIKTEPLFQMLSDTEQAPDEALPSTGIDPDFERQLSPLFIHTDNYGTRASTVLLIDNRDNVTFVERRFDKGVFTGEQSFSFQVIQ